MPNDFSTSASPTNQELLAAYRNALMAVAQNQETTVNGRTYRKADLDKITKAIEWLEDRIATEVSAGHHDGTGLVQARFH